MDVDILLKDIKKFTSLFNKIIKALLNDEIKYPAARFLFHEELSNINFESDTFVNVIKSEDLLSFDNLYNIVLNKTDKETNKRITELFSNIDLQPTITKYYLYNNENIVYSGSYDECITKFSDYNDINNLHIYTLDVNNNKQLVF